MIGVGLIPHLPPLFPDQRAKHPRKHPERRNPLPAPGMTQLGSPPAVGRVGSTLPNPHADGDIILFRLVRTIHHASSSLRPLAPTWKREKGLSAALGVAEQAPRFILFVRSSLSAVKPRAVVAVIAEPGLCSNEFKSIRYIIIVLFIGGFF